VSQVSPAKTNVAVTPFSILLSRHRDHAFEEISPRQRACTAA